MRAASATVWNAAASQPMQAIRRRRKTRRVSGQACMTSSTERSAAMRAPSMVPLTPPQAGPPLQALCESCLVDRAWHGSVGPELRSRKFLLTRLFPAEHSIGRACPEASLRAGPRLELQVRRTPHPAAAVRQCAARASGCGAGAAGARGGVRAGGAAEPAAGAVQRAAGAGDCRGVVQKPLKSGNTGARKRRPVKAGFQLQRRPVGRRSASPDQARRG